MDYEQLIEQLPTLYTGWGTDSLHPKSEQFQAALDRIQGMTTANVMQLLNAAVALMEPDEVYCEIGCFRGATLIGALLNQPQRLAYAVDNFSEFDPDGENLDFLWKNLAAFDLQEQVMFCNQDFEEFFADLRALQTSDRIGVYLYDGAHDYRSQLMGLLLVKPFLADRALIIVDDTNWDAVQQANWDFIAAHPQAQLILDLPTPENGHPSFWNGLHLIRWDIHAPHPDSAATLAARRKTDFIWALSQVSLCLGTSPVGSSPALQPLQEAEALYQLGITHYQAEQFAAAAEAIAQAIALDPSPAQYHYTLGVVYEGLQQIPQAAQAYQQAIDRDRTLIDAYNNLGNLVAQQGNPAQAVRIFHTAIVIQPTVGLYLNLGNVLLVQGEFTSAIAAYESGLALEPSHADTIANLTFARGLTPVQALRFSADSLHQRQRYAEAATRYEELLQSGTQSGAIDLGIYEALSSCYEQLHRLAEAIELCRRGLRQFPTATVLHLRQIRVLQDAGQTGAAIVQATQAAQLCPEEWQFQFQKFLLLPILYQTTAEIPIWHDRYQRGLDQLTQIVTNAPVEKQQQAIATVGQFSQFFLICQDANHRNVQQQYGQLVHQIMATAYPDWVQPLAMPSIAGKIRVGYVSGCLRAHTVGKLMLGWFRQHNRDRFEIYSYHVFNDQDDLTTEFRRYSDRFYQLPPEVEPIAAQIRADQVHILVFLEIGMQPLMTQLAGLRLAPIQATTWAHPITSGSPTIDYFLSSDLMEPEDAQEHYTEQLIRLPNLAISFAQPQISGAAATRSTFGLRQDAVVYLACQTLCKYLPHQDAAFAAIAQQVPNAQFVFIARPNPAIGKQFQQRLQRAFASVGLDSTAFCVMLPPQDQAHYWALNRVADVFLDSIGWSGGHTTLEAIACGLPIVTLPGGQMRGRHSLGILTMLGITETIARNEADYIRLAVELGSNPIDRSRLVQQMQEQQAKLYDDRAGIVALEAFYQQMVQDAAKI
jgi:predicted O-linked N-acetylglucosamine transferase (SPINDLY family)